MLSLCAQSSKALHSISQTQHLIERFSPCEKEEPDLTEIHSKHFVACLLFSLDWKHFAC